MNYSTKKMNYLFLNSILTIQEVTSCVNEYALLYGKLRMFWYCHRCVLLSSTVKELNFES